MPLILNFRFAGSQREAGVAAAARRFISLGNLPIALRGTVGARFRTALGMLFENPTLWREFEQRAADLLAVVLAIPKSEAQNEAVTPGSARILVASARITPSESAELGRFAQRVEARARELEAKGPPRANSIVDGNLRGLVNPPDVARLIQLRAGPGDEEEIDQKAVRPPRVVVVAQDLKVGNAADQKVMDPKAELRAWANQAEPTAQFMLIHGSAWVGKSMNKRAGLDRQDLKAGDPVTTIGDIKAAAADDLPEPMTQYFRTALLAPREKAPWPAVYAAQCVSAENLKKLQGYKLPHMKAFKHLCGFHLSLTHFAGAARHKGNELRLYSRHNLDENAEALGITDYPKENTPSSAMKNVGHHDYVFWSIEPRATEMIASMFKTDSRFGDVCHVIDSGAVNPYSLLTLGDLDTMNAKQSQSRLSAVQDGLYEISVASKRWIADQKITDPDTKKLTTIKVRNFSTRSEQMFLLKDAKEALALKVIELVDRHGVDVDLESITAVRYNNLLNGWFVPQVMIPRELITKNFFVFQGGKRVHPQQPAGHGAAAAASSSPPKGKQPNR